MSIELVAVTLFWAVGMLGVSLYLYRTNLYLRQKNSQLLKRRERDAQIRFLKSRNASMGELTADIAHQWKQPLNAIAAILSNLEATTRLKGEVPLAKLLDSLESGHKLIHHLGATIDTFHGFLTYKHSEEKVFVLSEVFETIQKLTEYAFSNSRIKLHFSLSIDPKIEGDANELVHALLNIVLNAKEVFEYHGIAKPIIDIKVEASDRYSCTITIRDNAGGITIEPIGAIFERYITTKPGGSGLGLFMSREIIVGRFGGTLHVSNCGDGACFSISLLYAGYLKDTASFNEENTRERVQRLSDRILELEATKNDLAKWADIFRHAHWGIAIHMGKSDRFELTNPAFNELFGYSQAELKNLRVADLFEEASQSRVSEYRQKVFNEGYGVFELVQKRKNGETFPATVEIIVVKNDEDEILYYMANVWDRSAEYEAQEMLKLQHFALDHISDAIFLMDVNGYFSFVNETACKQLGYSRDELLTMSVGDIDPYWPFEQWPQMWQEIKVRRQITVEVYHQRKDGSIFPVEVSANYFEYNGQEYDLAIARDITERKRLEAEKENRRIRAITENSPDIIVRFDTEGRCIYANPKAESLFERDESQIIGKTLCEMSPVIDCTVLETHLAEVIANGAECSFEKEYRSASGEKGWAHIRMVAERDDKNAIVSILAIGRDITQRVRMQERLEESRFALAEAQKLSHTGSWTMDMQTQKISWSDEYFRILEIEPRDSEAFFERFMQRVHPDDRAFLIERYAHWQETLEPYETEHRLIMNDGRIKYVVQHSETSYDAQNRPLFTIGTIQDITERKAMEASIRELNVALQERVKRSEEKFRAIVENAPDTITCYDLQCRRTYANPKMLELLAKPLESVIGTSPDDFSPLRQSAEFKKQFYRVVKEKQELSIKSIYSLPDGTQRWGEQRIIPEINTQGAVTGVMVVGRDIGEVNA